MHKKIGQQQNFLEGAIILIVGTMIVKVVSLLFKIPISNMIGGVGYSYFVNAYNIFDLLSTIATAGFPVAISKMISENNMSGNYKDSRKILSLSRKFFLFTGLFCMTIMFLGSGFFAGLLPNAGAKLSIMCLSPAVLTCCIMSAYRGYYQGMHNMYPTSISQIIEAVAKLIFGVGFTWIVINYTQNELAQSGTVLGKAYKSSAGASNAIYQLAAAAAVLGVTVSTVAGAVYLVLRHKIKGDGITKIMLANSPEPRRAKEILKNIITIGVPICMGSLAVSLSANIDMATVANRLTYVMQTNPEPLLKAYSGSLSANIIETNSVPNFLYGAYSSTAVTIANLVPAITAGFSISALPTVAEAWAKRNSALVQKSIEAVLRITALVCIPIGLGISALALPLCNMFFSSKASIAVGAPLLSVLAIAAIFIALTGTLTSLLQAVGKVAVPVKLIILGGAIKLFINFIFVGFPSINIKAVPIATLACYGIIVFLSLYLLAEATEEEYHFVSILGKPFIAGAACAMTARCSWKMIYFIWPSKLAVIPAIMLGGLVYVIIIFLIKGIHKEDVMMVPKGEKIVKILEKYSLLG